MMITLKMLNFVINLLLLQEILLLRNPINQNLSGKILPNKGTTEQQNDGVYQHKENLSKQKELLNNDHILIIRIFIWLCQTVNGI